MELDLTCYCLTNIKDFEWIILDPSASTLTVQTSNNSYIGEYRMVLVQSFQNFEDVNPFTAFNISILPAFVSKSDIQMPPYLEEELVPQNVL